MYIYGNKAPYIPNTLNNGNPQQANQQTGKGFFTSPDRSASGRLVRAKSDTFADVYSQPRLFFNSLLPVEQQWLINAIRFETSHIQSATVKQNVLAQLNLVSNDIATQVAEALGLSPPPPNSTYYHSNKTAGVSIFAKPLRSLAGLTVGVLTSVAKPSTQVADWTAAFAQADVNVLVVAEHLGNGADLTYSAADAIAFDGIIVADGSGGLFTGTNTSLTLYPAGRPLQIVVDSYRFGKAVGFVDDGIAGLTAARPAIGNGGPGVYIQGASANTTASGAQRTQGIVGSMEDGLRTFRFLDRFPVEG
jgi:catalase